MRAASTLVSSAGSRASASWNARWAASPPPRRNRIQPVRAAAVARTVSEVAVARTRSSSGSAASASSARSAASAASRVSPTTSRSCGTCSTRSSTFRYAAQASLKASIRRVGLARAHPGRERALQVADRVPVPGHLPDDPREAVQVGGQGIGGRQVEPGALARHQPGLQHLAERRVVEVDPQVVVDLHDVRGHGRPQRRVELRGGQPRRTGQQGQRRATADHGGRPQHAAGVVGQARQAAVEQVVQVGREERALAGGERQLLDEQGVARRAGDHVGQQACLRLLAAQLRHQGGGVGLVEPVQRAAVRRATGVRARPATGTSGSSPTASVRWVSTTSTRSSTRFVAKKASRSSVDRSAHWTSSTTCTTGRCAERRPSSPSTAWNSRSREPRAVAGSVPPARSVRARRAAAGPARATWPAPGRPRRSGCAAAPASGRRTAAARRRPARSRRRRPPRPPAPGTRGPDGSCRRRARPTRPPPTGDRRRHG